MTIHFIDNHSELHHYLLETKEFPESHTSLNIANELTNILEEWNLGAENVAVITTNHGRNIAAVDQLNFEQLYYLELRINCLLDYNVINQVSE